MSDKDYEKVYRYARDLATKTGRDVGIEKNRLFGTFNTIMLPNPENRYGHELRCEVVHPGQP